MFDKFEKKPEAVIKVMGVGGAGGNAVNEMARQGIDGVNFIAVNTDAQALSMSDADKTIQIGMETTKGYGCGAMPKKGYDSAVESEDSIRAELGGTDMLFIAAGMGGGTGTGASPVVAKVAKEMGILCIAVVVKPFKFEMGKRAQAASLGVESLKEHVDSLIVIENEKLLKTLPSGTGLHAAFKEADNVLCNAVRAIAQVITAKGQINVDFADVCTVMKSKGRALMGVGRGSGENRAIDAANRAIESPLLEDFDMKAAKGIVCTISHGFDFGLNEMGIVGEKIAGLASEDAITVLGTIPNEDLEDECVVTVIATGIDGSIETDLVQMTAPEKQPVEKVASVPVNRSPLDEKEPTPTVANHAPVSELNVLESKIDAHVEHKEVKKRPVAPGYFRVPDVLKKS